MWLHNLNTCTQNAERGGKLNKGLLKQEGKEVCFTATEQSCGEQLVVATTGRWAARAVGGGWGEVHSRKEVCKRILKNGVLSTHDTINFLRSKKKMAAIVIAAALAAFSHDAALAQGITLKTYTNMALFGTPAKTEVINSTSFSLPGGTPLSAELVGT